MKALILSFWVVLCLSPQIARAEGGGNGVYTQTEEQRIHEEDLKKVLKMREILERKYQGKIQIIDGVHIPTKTYINWIMEPFDQLVKKQTLMTRLRFLEVVGPTSGGKSQILRDAKQLAEDFGFLDSDKRWKPKQGTPDRGIELDPLKDLMLTETELKQGSSAAGYLAVKDQFKKSYAILFLDEASLYAKPPENLEKAYWNALHTLKREFDKTKSARRKERLKPEAPTEPSPGGSKVTYQKAVADYRKKMIAYEFAQALYKTKDVTSFDREIQKLKTKYAKDAEQRSTLNSLIHAIWQSTSGGWYEESQESEKNNELQGRIEAAWHARNNWLVDHKASPMFENHMKFFIETGETEDAIDAGKKDLNALEAQRDVIAAKKKDFGNISLRAIEAFINKEDPTGQKVLDWVRQLENDGDLSPLAERIVQEMKADPEFMRVNQFGYKEEVDNRGSELAQALKRHIESHFDRVGAGLQKKIDIKIDDVNELDEKYKWLKGIEEAYVKTLKDDHDRKEVMERLREYKKLHDAYVEVIVEAAEKSGAGRDAIEQQYTKLVVGSDGTPITKDTDLRKWAPQYYQMLKNLHPTDPNYPATYLRAVANSNDIKRKIRELLKMNPEVTLQLVKDAMKSGQQTKRFYLGGINVVMALNDTELERRTKHRVDTIRRTGKDPSPRDMEHKIPDAPKGREVTPDEFLQIYVEERDQLYQERQQDSAQHFLRGYFPDFFKELMKAAEGGDNPGAAERRLSEGHIDMLPRSSKELVYSVAGTADYEFHDLLDKLDMLGIHVKGHLFVHENVPAFFLHKGLRSDLGMSSILTEANGDLKAMMLDLEGQLIELHRENVKHGAKPDEAMDLNFALQVEKGVGREHNLTLRYYDPLATPEIDVKRETYGQRGLVLSGTPPIMREKPKVAARAGIWDPAQSVLEMAVGEGPDKAIVHLDNVPVDVNKLELPPKGTPVTREDFLKKAEEEMAHVVDVAQAEKQALTAAAQHDTAALKAQHDAELARAKADADAQIAALKAQKEALESQVSHQEEVKQEQVVQANDARWKKLVRELENKLQSNPTTASLKQFYDKIEDEEKKMLEGKGLGEDELARQADAAAKALRDKIRDRLLKYAKDGDYGANMGHLYTWLKFDADNDVDIDAWLIGNGTETGHWPEIREHASIPLQQLFPKLILEGDERGRLNKEVRPGLFKGTATWAVCRLSFNKLGMKDVPVDYRSRAVPMPPRYIRWGLPSVLGAGGGYGIIKWFQGFTAPKKKGDAKTSGAQR